PHAIIVVSAARTHRCVRVGRGWDPPGTGTRAHGAGARVHRNHERRATAIPLHLRAASQSTGPDPQRHDHDRDRAGDSQRLDPVRGWADRRGGREGRRPERRRGRWWCGHVRGRPARTVQEMKFPGARYGLKMACGENPKRVYGRRGGPSTRMGNMAGYRAAFILAEAYRRRWDAWNKDHKGDPPERNLRSESLAE